MRADLHDVYRRCADYVQYVNDRALRSSYDVSQFWARELQSRDRINYPSFGEMLTMRRGATYPMAESPACTDPAVEQRLVAAAHAVVAQSVPPDYLASVRESDIGDPRLFEIDGQKFSASGLINALTSYRIRECIRARFSPGRHLRILEIGAGYGQVAEHLLRQLPIDRYVVCDLPENLFLSSFYLQASFPEKTARFLRPDDEQTHGDSAEAALQFLVPHCLDVLPGPFDLIINTYSFQEMTRTSVDRYFEFVRHALDADGILYSLNAHGKSGLERASMFPIDGFRIASLGPVRRVPHHYVFATNPYEMVLVPDETTTTPRASCVRTQLDALCDSFQFGLDRDLAGLVQRFVDGSLETRETEWLKRIHEVLDTGSAASKRRAVALAKACDVLPVVTQYLSGVLAFAESRRDDAYRDLAQAQKGLSSPYARALASLMLAWLCRMRKDAEARRSYFEAACEPLSHLREELESWLDRPLPERMAEQLRLDCSPTVTERIRRVGSRWFRAAAGADA